MATVGATEGLVDAIEMATAEVARLEEHHAEQEQVRTAPPGGAAGRARG